MIRRVSLLLLMGWERLFRGGGKSLLFLIRGILLFLISLRGPFLTRGRVLFILLRKLGFYANPGSGNSDYGGYDGFIHAGHHFVGRKVVSTQRLDGL